MEEPGSSPSRLAGFRGDSEDAGPSSSSGASGPGDDALAPLHAEASGGAGADADAAAPAPAQQQQQQQQQQQEQQQQQQHRRPAAAAATSKRRRVEGGGDDDIRLLLYVRWIGPSSGQTKVNVLQLDPVSGVADLKELGRELVEKAYPPPGAMPGFLTSDEFARFTPSRECLAVPGDIVRTVLRLVVVHRGWEYCVLQRALTAQAAPECDMLVTAIEFEGRPEEAILGTLGFRISLIAYPIVGIKKAFLEDVKERLLRDPAQFKGIM